MSGFTPRRDSSGETAAGGPGAGPDAGCPDAAPVAGGPQPEAGGDALERVWIELAALRAHVAQLLAVRADLALAGLRAVRRRIAMALLGLTLSVVVAVAAGIYLMRGAVGGLAAMCGGRVWLGELIVGVGGLGLLAAAWIWSERVHQRRRVQKAREKYEPERNSPEHSPEHSPDRQPTE